MLELGCGTGDLLAALEPSLGVGVDFAPEMLKRAAKSHPQLRFVQGDVDQLGLNTGFDYVILSDLINDLWDVQTTIERIASVCTPATRVIINTYSRMWELPLRMAGRMNLANPALNQNWLTLADLDNMLALGGFEVVRQWQEVLLPLGAAAARAALQPLRGETVAVSASGAHQLHRRAPRRLKPEPRRAAPSPW